MAKIVMIVPPLMGHINPTVALGQQLLASGHDVVWLGYEVSLRRSLPPQYRVIALDEEGDDWMGHQQVTDHGAQERRGFAGLHYLWESVFIPLAQRTFHTVERLLHQERPDLCIVDQQMLSGALVCQKWAYPYLTSATTSAALINPLEGLPQVQEWHRQLLVSLWEDFQVTPPDTSPYLELSPLGTIAFSSQRMALSTTNGALPRELTSPVYFVGPAIEGERSHIDFPWERIDKELPKLFVSMGTINAERAAPLYQRLIEGLADLPLQVIAAAPPKYFAEAPVHWIIQDRVPQLQLLGYMDVVFCHGGHNTTMEALTFGLPLVIAPIRDDQPVIAEQVKAVGAGQRVHFSRVKPSQLRIVIENALNDPKYREVARSIRNDLLPLSSLDPPPSLDCYPVQSPKRLGAYRAMEVISDHLTRLGVGSETSTPHLS